MIIERLESFIKPNQTIEKDGIYVAKEIAEKTVWDKLAIENPTHAVISAKDEEQALEKSEEQIKDICHQIKPGDVMLDCGTGYGRVAKYILPKMTLGGFIGVDSSYEMLTLFKQRYHSTLAEQKTPLLLINADMYSLPVESDSVDVVLVSAVFLHNHKSVVAKAIPEIRRVLKPGGKVLVYSSFPRTVTFMGLQGHAYQILLNLLGKPFKNGPVRYYRRAEISHLFDAFTELDLIPHGYEVIPKSIIILPKFLDVIWREFIAKPVNSLLEKITPSRLKPYFAVHFDVVAVK